MAISSLHCESAKKQFKKKKKRKKPKIIGELIRIARVNVISLDNIRYFLMSIALIYKLIRRIDQLKHRYSRVGFSLA